jgi:hypothetical protein
MNGNELKKFSHEREPQKWITAATLVQRLQLKKNSVES